MWPYKQEFSRMTQNKISWKAVAPYLVEVRIPGKNNDDPIGCARLVNHVKWSIEAYFAVLAEDKHFLKKKFDSEIEAGRQLAKLWNTMEEINLRDTQEFFFDMNDLFGPSD